MDELEHEAIQTDVYLDRLLASRWDPPAPIGPEASDDEAGAELRETAALLRRTLVRFHPSFRFEEALAARLRAAAGGAGDAAQASTGVRLIPFPGPGVRSSSSEAALALDRRGRGLLVGGAIASGVSIASIAGVVLWRRNRGATGIHLGGRLI